MHIMVDDLIIMFVACPHNQADSIAETLVSERLAACVNIFPVKSVYIWKDKLNKDSESLLIIKSRLSITNQLENRIKQLNQYEIPEIVTIKSEKVESDYLNWVFSQTQ